MKAASLLALGLGLIATGLFAQDSPAWLGFPAGLNHSLVEERDGGAVRIPINVLPGSPPLDKLQARLRDVVFHEGRAESLAKTFTAQLDPGDQRRGPSLLVEARPLPVLPGSYVLSLDISETAPAAGQSPKAQALTLTLQRPEPKLATSSQLLVDQTFYFWYSCSSASRMRLTEQSKKAALTGVQFEDVRDPASNLPVDAATLAVTLQPPEVASGSVVFPDVKVQGDFPLGTTAGKLEVRADQLATPLTINYEVRARRTTWWIAGITALGFGFGWLIRHYLRKRHERAKARAAASAVLQEIRTALAQIPDADFRDAVAKAREDLLQAERNPNVETVQKATTKAAEDLATARTTLAARRKSVVETFEPLAALARRSWQLPSDAAATGLAQLRTELGEVKRLIEQHDIGQARDRLAQLPTGVLVKLVQDLSDWRAEAAKYLVELGRHPPALPASGADQLRQAVESWKAAFTTPTAADTDISLQEATAALDMAHSANAAARQIAERLVTDSTILVQWVNTLLSPLPLAPGNRLESLEEVTAQAARAVQDELKSPAENERHVAPRERRLGVDWEGILYSVLPPGTTAPAIQESIAQRRWTDAAQAAAEALRALPPRRPAADEAATEAAPLPAPAPAAAPIFFRTSLASGGGTAPLLIGGVPPLTGTVAEREALEKEAWWALALQKLFFAVLFVLVAYVLYYDKWVGTLHEMLALFIWAFGVDITSEAVMNAAKTIKPPPS